LSFNSSAAIIGGVHEQNDVPQNNLPKKIADEMVNKIQEREKAKARNISISGFNFYPRGSRESI
jgi:hypothetical protein